MLNVLYLLIAIALINVETTNLQLNIIHFNDFHARFEPLDQTSTTCNNNDNCIGGFSRLYTAINQLKRERPNSIVLNAGDNFQGTLWYIVHKWNVTQFFLNKLPLDAITLGNHEFDDGIDGLVPFLKSIKAPVTVSNIDIGSEPRLNNLFNKSIIIEVKGKKIGIIGVLTTSTKSTSNTENVIFKDELSSVNLESEKLAKHGVFTNIVLSHCGYEADVAMAKNLSSKISAIVGGHTDTFLYSKTPIPSADKPLGPYPTLVQSHNGNTILIVQAFAYTKYLGNLSVLYDDVGSVLSWDGTPVFLGNHIQTDKNIDDSLKEWKIKVDQIGNKIIGTTVSSMPKEPCRAKECTLGNFATDAMLFRYPNASIALIHAGGLRAGLNQGNISLNQLVCTFPFQDSINICEIKGEHIKHILESVMDNYHIKQPHLFQVSGLKIIYNITMPEGNRVQSLELCSGGYLGSNCNNLDMDLIYKTLLPQFLTDSIFNPLFQKYIQKKVIGDLSTDIYDNYLHFKSPLLQTVDKRIQFVT